MEPKGVDLSRIIKSKKLLELYGIEEQSAGEIVAYLASMTQNKWKPFIQDKTEKGTTVNIGMVSFCSYMQGLTDGLKARKDELDQLAKALVEIQDILTSLDKREAPASDTEVQPEGDQGSSERTGSPEPASAGSPEATGADTAGSGAEAQSGGPGDNEAQVQAD